MPVESLTEGEEGVIHELAYLIAIAILEMPENSFSPNAQLQNQKEVEQQINSVNILLRNHVDPITDPIKK